MSELLVRNFITSGKSHVYSTGIGRPSLQRGVILQWFCSPQAVGTPWSEVHALHRVPFYFRSIYDVHYNIITVNQIGHSNDSIGK